MAVLAGIIPGIAIIAECPTQATGHWEVRTTGVTGIGNHHLAWRIAILYTALDKTFFFDLSEPEWGSPMTETAWNV
jgi:hypothetical protein